MKRNFFLTLLLSFLLVSSSLAAAEKAVYSFGIVPQFETKKIFQIWNPILEYLEKTTGHKFEIRNTSSIPDFEKSLLGGKFDFAYMNPFHLVIANQQQGYTPLVRDFRDQLTGILVVKKDSEITDPKQLNGKKIAFPSPNALGASLLMRQELTDHFGIQFTPEYVNTHDSVYLNVLLEETAAGGGVLKTLNSQKPGYRDMLRIIHRTVTVNPHPLAVHPDVPGQLKADVLNALLNMAQSEEGRLLLEKIPMKRIGPSSIEDYLLVKEMALERFYVAPK